MRWVHRIVLAIGAVLIGWIFVRSLAATWIGGKAGDEIEAASRLLGLTDELRGIFKVLGSLVLIDLMLPLLTSGGASLLGRRIRWTPGMTGRVAALIGFFALKPTVATLTGLDFRDGMPSKVVEINPGESEIFDSRTSAPLAGVVIEGDGMRRFYNLRQGVRPADGARIQPATPEDIAQWKARRPR
ncbi:MAG: hypothetical protein QOD99_2873 [Chthoniobacter sp.]|nr:hypothetical protein [Chthoniobacter sp.]